MTKREKALIRKQILDGSIYTKKRYKNWRKKIFERDRYKCQFPGCEKVGGHLEGHHIKKKFKFPELIYNIENGITLCKACHSKMHQEGTESEYVRFFKKKAKENKPRPRIIRRVRR